MITGYAQIIFCLARGHASQDVKLQLIGVGGAKVPGGA